MKGRIPNYRHIHLGDGPLMTNLKIETERKALGETLFFAGTVNNVITYLNKSHILVHFAEFEGTPNAIMEAMNVGLPIITTSCGDANILVKDNINGFVIEPYNTEEFAKKVLSIIENPEKEKQFGINSGSLITKYSPSNIFTTFLKILEKN
jgi:glycosyltransferase involved in cell wall biosynthesis